MSWECKCGGLITRVGKHRGGDRVTRCHVCDDPKKVKGTEKYVPFTDTAVMGMELVNDTLEWVGNIQPKFWWMENPRALLRKLIHFRSDIPRTTITFCHYGENRMKPTDLWGQWPKSWTPQPACKNGNPCHEAAPRGSRTGTQGIKTSALRAAIPYALSLEVCLAAEKG